MRRNNENSDHPPEPKVFAGATNGVYLAHGLLIKKYGRQFKGKYRRLEKRPATAASWKKYLRSGLVLSELSPKLLRKIVKHF